MYEITEQDRKFNPYQYNYLKIVFSQKLFNDVEFIKSCCKEKDNTSEQSAV